MRFVKFAALALTALLAVAATRPGAGGWNARIAVSPTGSHVIGNPAAATKLTEFISYTCSHCADFDRQASDPLRLFYVTPGKLSIEISHLVRDPIDLTVAMLTNCGAPTKFLQNHTTFLRQQSAWMGRAGGVSPGQQSRWSSGEMVSRRKAIADDLGFYQTMLARGYDRSAVDRCLADDAMARKLMAQTTEAQRLGVPGTPSFAINGELLEGIHHWDGLKAQLQTRIR